MLRQAEGIFRLHYTRVSILIRLLFIPSGKLNPNTASRKTEGNQPKEWPISPDSFFFFPLISFTTGKLLVPSWDKDGESLSAHCGEATRECKQRCVCSAGQERALGCRPRQGARSRSGRYGSEPLLPLQTEVSHTQQTHPGLTQSSAVWTRGSVIKH